jgi:ELWxxDGT repeat protein
MGAGVFRVVAGALTVCLLPLGLVGPVGAEDGTTVPPRPVVSMLPDLAHQYFDPDPLTEWQGELVFSGGSPDHERRRLFMTTAHGEPVREVLNPAQDLGIVGDGHGSALVMTAGDRLVTMARSYHYSTPTGRTQMWAVDAPGAPAVQLTDFPSAAGVPPDPAIADFPGLQHMVAVGDSVYFFVRWPDSWELWATDGTVAGTGRLEVLPPDVTHIRDWAAVGDRLFFNAALPQDENANSPTRLWVSDGTEDGTRAVGGELRDRTVSILTAMEDELVVAVDGRVVATDGSADGLRLVWDRGAEAGRLAAASYDGSGRLYLVLEDFFWMDVKVWSSDGTPEGTVPVSGWIDSGWVWDAAATRGRFYLITREGGTSGQRLYGFTEESGVVTLLRGYDPDTDGAVTELAPVNGWAFFMGNDTTHGLELWASDGTVPGTGPVGDHPTVPGGCRRDWLRRLTPVGDSLFYVRDDTTCGADQLWRATAVPLPVSVRLPDAPPLTAPPPPVAPQPATSPVDARVDGLTVRARKRQRQDTERVRLVVRVGAAESIGLEVRARLRSRADGPALTMGRRLGPTSEGAARTVVMVKNGPAARRFLRLLRADPRASGRAVVRIRAIDASGNVERRRIAVKVILTHS